MKKLMTIGLAAAMLFALAGQASATALETSGELRARGWWVDNYVVDGKTTEWFDQRLRLTLVWPVAENVKVNVRADILEGFWGDNNAAFNTTFNTTTNQVTSSTSGFGTRPPINFDHVNMQFVWPGTPMTFTVGRQDVSYATGMYASKDNRDRFKVVAKFSPELSVLFAYDKTAEQFASEGSFGIDDARGWSVAGFGTVQGWFWGVLALYALDDTNPNTAGNITRIGVDATTSGKLGPVDLKVDVAYVTGDNKVPGKSKVDATGMMAYVSAAMPAGPVTVTLEGAYAAGDDPATKDKNEGAARFDYNSSFWSIILYSNLDVPGYVGSSSGNQLTSSVNADTSVTNAVAAKASVAWTPVKGFTLIGSAVYAQALQDVPVTVVPAKAATAITPAVPAVTKTLDADALGTEFDVVAVYNITDNVYFLGGLGYLVAGNVFGEVDNPLGVMGSLNVKF
jgi:hypothetical protein